MFRNLFITLYCTILCLVLFTENTIALLPEEEVTDGVLDMRLGLLPDAAVCPTTYSIKQVIKSQHLSCQHTRAGTLV